MWVLGVEPASSAKSNKGFNLKPKSLLLSAHYHFCFERQDRQTGLEEHVKVWRHSKVVHGETTGSGQALCKAEG